LMSYFELVTCYLQSRQIFLLTLGRTHLVFRT